VRSCEHGNEPSGSKKFWEFFDWLEWLFNNDCLLGWLVPSLAKRIETKRKR